MYVIDIIMKNRDLVALLKKRLAEKEPLIQVIVGPRQVGKTTALKAILSARDHYHSADGLMSSDLSLVESWWKKVRSPAILAIDEVQKIPNWSEIIKKLWDTGPKLKVVLTGSSALLMERGLNESLAGRFELIQVEHWNYMEAKRIFNMDIKKFIEFGCYPGSYRFLDNGDIDRWGNYIRDSIIEPVIGKDLLQLHPVKNPSLLRQVFGMAIAMPAQVISLQKIQGQLQNKGSIPTLQHYLELLEKSFLVSGIKKYTTSKFRKKRSSPKLIVHDNALIRAFERPVSSPISAECFGRYFENQVGARFIEAGWDVFYWRDKSQEVDFVVIGPNNEKWAIEVKSGKYNKKDLSGMELFCKRYPDFTPKLVSFNTQNIDGVESLKVDEILALCRNL